MLRAIASATGRIRTKISGAASSVVVFAGKFLQEDGTSFFLLEDGVSFLLGEG